MRRRGVVLCAALALAGTIGLAVSSASGDEEIIRKGKLATDGVMTVGQPETVFIKGLPPRKKVRVSVTANDQRCQSVKAGFCTPEPASRLAGTPRFRTSGKGRAVLTFVMPTGYDFLHLKPPFKSQPTPFTNGEPLLIDATVDAAVRIHGESRHLIGIAQAGAVAEVPQPPAAP
jgi:hypothetical protein